MKALKQLSAGFIYRLQYAFYGGYLLMPVFFFVALGSGFVVFSDVRALDPDAAAIINDPSPEIMDPNATAEYDPAVLLVKFKQNYRPKLNDGNAENPGVASVDKTFDQNDVTSFEQVAETNSKARTNTELFGWYKVEINNGQAPEAISVDDKKVYPELEMLQANLDKDPAVQEVTKDYLVKATATVPNDPYYSSTGSWGQAYDDLWGLKKINSANAWDTTTGSSSTVVAVIDTGVDRNLADLSPNIWSNSSDPTDGIDNDNNGYIDDTYGWNWCADNNSSLDDHGHGTHVAGTIGAKGNNASGVVGVNWNVKMMSLKFLCSNGSGATSDGAQALQYAADNGAKISSNSWGCSCHDPITEDAITYEIGKGTTPIVAAGNDGGNALDTEPASADGAITVGATDNTNAIASFSNTGLRLDLVAPGVDILSLKSSQVSGVCNTAGQILNTNFCHISGTSMATPHVSGVAALMLSVNPSLNTEQIRQILRTSSQDLGTTGRDTTFGSGLLNAQAAVAASTSPTVLTPKITSPASRSTLTGSVNITGSASGTNFSSYKVEIGFGRDPGGTWTTVATSNTPVSNGVLATLNTTSFIETKYTIRLTTTDTSGKTYEYSLYDVAIHNIEAKVEMPQLIVPKGQVKVYGKASMLGSLVFGHYSIQTGIQTVDGSTAPVMNSNGVTLVNGGNTAAPNSGTELGTIDTTNWEEGKTYEILLAVYSSTGQYNQQFIFVQVDSSIQSGWPKYVPGADCYTYCSRTTPLFADLNGDGNKEVVIPANTNKIYAFNKDGTAVSGWPVTLATGDYMNTLGHPIATDIDGDLLPEIIFESNVGTTMQKHLYVVKGNGQILAGWPKTIGMKDYYSDPMPSAADLNADGKKELVMFTDDTTNGKNLHAFQPDGTELTGFPKALSFTPWTLLPPTIYDMDNDGNPEIAVPSYNKIYVYTNQGILKTGWPVTLPTSNGNLLLVKAPISVADLKGDGNHQYIISGILQLVTGDTAVYAYSATGSLLSGWPYRAVSYVPTDAVFGTDNYPPVVADIDSDGKDEVIMPGWSINHTDRGTAIIKDVSGPISTPYHEIYSSPSLADINGTGTPQIAGKCFTCHSESVDKWLFRYADVNATTIWKSKALGEANMGGANSQFISADLDRNNHQDFAKTMYSEDQLSARDGSYTYLFESASTSNPKDSWPMFDHDAQRTGRFISGQKGPDTTSPEVVVTSPVASAQVHGSVVVAANALDEVQISKVDFYADGNFVGTDTTWPYSTTWDTTGLTGTSTHLLTAKAYDSSNNSRTSASVSVQITGTVPGDVNGDGAVNIYDLSLLLSKFNQSYPAADFNASNKVDIFDLSILLAHYSN